MRRRWSKAVESLFAGWTVCLFCSAAFAAESPPLRASRIAEKWQFLPFIEQRFPPLIADPLEEQTAVFFHDGRKAQGNVGNHLLIIDHIWRDRLRGTSTAWSVGFEGTIFSLMHIPPKGGFALDSTDSKFGFFVHYLINDFQTRFSILHISSHVADGLFDVEHPKRNYSREYFKFDIAYPFAVPFGIFRPYVGAIFNYHVAVPSELEGDTPFAFQWGSEYHTPQLGNLGGFAAIDANIKQEHRFRRVNLRVLAGSELYGDKRFPVRLAAVYDYGFNWRGIFYDIPINQFGFGMILSY